MVSTGPPGASHTSLCTRPQRLGFSSQRLILIDFLVACDPTRTGVTGGRQLGEKRARPTGVQERPQGSQRHEAVTARPRRAPREERASKMSTNRVVLRSPETAPHPRSRTGCQLPTETSHREAAGPPLEVCKSSPHTCTFNPQFWLTSTSITSIYGLYISYQAFASNSSLSALQRWTPQLFAAGARANSLHAAAQ